ncbi:hypothetical protein DFH08DRAFT_1041262 [Mycena albidolilacea]|uniref:Transmembrane protein n=1 Tax=Mycena albidolilacea TaxID=1033008 RepID=A0AAD6ZBA0_9AGAR|nr:hypothetical protein DFH08DRAFT_1041262 [Mycena albidolilacea]
MSETTNASKSDSKTQTYSWTSHLLICVVLTVVAIVVSFGITKHLILGDVNDNVPYTGSAEQQIRLRANYIEVDPTLRTVTVDWFPLPLDCSANPEMVVKIFADPNLLVPAGWGEDATPSTTRPFAPIFELNTTHCCQHTNYDSFPIFRTVLKMTGLSGSDQLTPRTGTLQAYPHDQYFFQVSMFAQMASTNASVGLVLGSSFGIPINFDVLLDKSHSVNNDNGILLYFTVSRSAAVIGLVITIVTANWLVTIAFLWITVAAFMWETDIVAEMFVLPVATLFAFTTVRSNFPGAPAGFGAVVDYYGILPNIGLITLFTAVLLFGVLYRRIATSISKMSNNSTVPRFP